MDHVNNTKLPISYTSRILDMIPTQIMNLLDKISGVFLSLKEKWAHNEVSNKEELQQVCLQESVISFLEKAAKTSILKDNKKWRIQCNYNLLLLSQQLSDDSALDGVDKIINGIRFLNTINKDNCEKALSLFCKVIKSELDNKGKSELDKEVNPLKKSIRTVAKEKYSHAWSALRQILFKENAGSCLEGNKIIYSEDMEYALWLTGTKEELCAYALKVEQESLTGTQYTYLKDRTAYEWFKKAADKGCGASGKYIKFMGSYGLVPSDGNLINKGLLTKTESKGFAHFKARKIREDNKKTAIAKRKTEKARVLRQEWTDKRLKRKKELTKNPQEMSRECERNSKRTPRYIQSSVSQEYLKKFCKEKQCFSEPIKNGRVKNGPRNNEEGIEMSSISSWGVK